MWEVKGTDLKMVEGDFGIKLPISVDDATLTANDVLRLTIKSAMNGETLVEKEYTNIQNNTIDFEITEAETELLPVGVYVYSLDWYQSGAFMGNLIPSSIFKVVDKA